MIDLNQLDPHFLDQVKRFKPKRHIPPHKITVDEASIQKLLPNWPAQPASITDPLSHTTGFAYDTSGNLTTVTDPDNKQTTLTYNSRGQVLTRTNALSKTTTYTYNNTNGNLETITNPLNKTVTLGYDTLGRVTTIQDPKSQTTTLTYDDTSRVTKVKDALNKETLYTYDNNDTLLTVKNARGFDTTMTYDRKERLLTQNKKAGTTNLTTTYTYDAADRLTQVLDPKGQKLKLTYDSANRLTQVQVEVSSVNTHTYTYTYDNGDRLTQISDGTHTWSMTYDNANRVTQAVSPLATINYTYNNDDQRTQMSVVGQTAVDYDYDVVGRLIEVAQGTQVYNYAYDAIGRRTWLTRPNAVNTTYTYDNANQLTQLLSQKTGGLTEQHDYTYDNNGNILTHSYGGGTRTFTYDALNRLSQMDKTVAVPGETLPKKIEYSYDNVGNMTLRKETDDANNVTTYTKTFDSADRLTQVAASPGATVTYSYDLNSNLTGDSTGRSFSWNGLDQLTSMTVGSTTTSFGYDPLGRRKSWTQGSTSKAYYYDGLNLLNDGTSSFLNGAGIDEPLERTASSTISTYLQDHLGSVTQVTNASGVSTGQYAYTPFGKLLSSSTPVAGNPFSYTAREDDGTGLYYYRARYYDPSLEAFLSQDPYGDAQRYAGGNPISFLDPLGLIDVLFKFGGLGFPHAAILSEPTNGINNHRYVYESLPGDPFNSKRSSTNNHLLSEMHLYNGQHGYLVELNIADDSFAPNSQQLSLWSGLGSNCSTYAGQQLNYEFEKRGIPTLSPLEMQMPQLLYQSLFLRGVVKRVTEYQGDFKKPVNTYDIFNGGKI